MEEIELTEGGGPIYRQLDADVVMGLTQSSAVSAEVIGPNRWELSARQKVGAFSTRGMLVRIRPKVPIARLLWMLGWSARELFSLEGSVGLQRDEDLVPAIAAAYTALLEQAVLQGLIQGYTTVNRQESVVRGRIRVGDQLRKSFGMPIPLLVTYDDLSFDTPENRILKRAAVSLLQMPAVPASVRRRLLKLRNKLADVTLIAAADPPPRWVRTRLNARYHDALALAELIIQDASLEVEAGTVRVHGFLVDMFNVFERFVTLNLKRELERHGGACRLQDPFSLDDGGKVPIRPDLVWRAHGRPVAAVDAKYKSERPSGFPQADLYQALAYAVAYGLPRAELVYAKGNEVEQSWSIRESGVEITAHALELDRPPGEVLDRIRSLADGIARRSLPKSQAMRGAIPATL